MLKVINALYGKACTVFCYRDPAFPRDRAGAPCSQTVSRMRACREEIADFFRGTGKLAIQESFDRKLNDVSSVGMVSQLVELARAMRAELPAKLDELEILAGGQTSLSVSARKPVDGRRANLRVRHAFTSRRDSLVTRN